MIFRNLMNLKEWWTQIGSVVGMECTVRPKLELHSPLASSTHRSFIPLEAGSWVFRMCSFLHTNSKASQNPITQADGHLVLYPYQTSSVSHNFFLPLGWSQGKLALGLGDRKKSPLSLTQSYSASLQVPGVTPKFPRWTLEFSNPAEANTFFRPMKC